ncbi:MAG TPA: acetoin utilization protein AcuC, partial [Actinomycetota bacterium]|nr:acetoin utilization protein AcuC [Actinomycetota bacterium]
FVFGEEMLAYNLGDEHPLSPVRRQLAVELMRAYGLLDHPDVHLVAPRPATVEEIERVHAPAYVAAVRRLSAQPDLAVTWEAAQWGLGAGGDTPAFAGMHEAAAAICGASVTGAMEIWEGRADQVFSAGGGLHHAFANRAAGFCIYNDCAVAIQAMLDAGAERIAYVDVDVHHGDGVQAIFWNEPRVLTVSIHEYAPEIGFFPGTGSISERGGPDAPDSVVNLPLPPGTSDEGWLEAFRTAVPPIVRAFGPDVLVTQLGCDSHATDPLAHLALTTAAYRVTAAVLHELAHEAAGGRWVATGGGGYQWARVVPRAWTIGFAEMAQASPPDEIPEPWIERAEFESRGEVPATLSDPPARRSPADEEAVAVGAAVLGERGGGGGRTADGRGATRPGGSG